MSGHEISDILPDILSNGSIVRIYGHKYIIIENYKSIIEYTDKIIRLQGKNERININGKNLCIAFYNTSDMRIDGIISNVTFEE